MRYCSEIQILNGLGIRSLYNINKITLTSCCFQSKINKLNMYELYNTITLVPYKNLGAIDW